MKYERLQGSDPLALHETLESKDPERVCPALVGAAHSSDAENRVHIEAICIRLARSEDDWIAKAALTSLGHLVRLHGVLDLDEVNPLLDALACRPGLKSRVADLRDDISVFISR